MGSHIDYLAAIEALPLVQTPDVFGLHANADISYYTNATKQMWRDLVSLWESPPVIACLHASDGNRDTPLSLVHILAAPARHCLMAASPWGTK